jgi:hypothetical protein
MYENPSQKADPAKKNVFNEKLPILFLVSSIYNHACDGK